MFVLLSGRDVFHQALFGLAAFNLRNLQWMNTLRAAGSGVCDDTHYQGWVIRWPDSLCGPTSQSWSCQSPSRNRAGTVSEPGWGPAVAVACPLSGEAIQPISRERWLPSWNYPVWGRRARGNADLKVLSEQSFFCFSCWHSLKVMLCLKNAAKTRNAPPGTLSLKKTKRQTKKSILSLWLTLDDSFSAAFCQRLSLTGATAKRSRSPRCSQLPSRVRRDMIIWQAGRRMNKKTKSLETFLQRPDLFVKVLILSVSCVYCSCAGDERQKGYFQVWRQTLLIFCRHWKFAFRWKALVWRYPSVEEWDTSQKWFTVGEHLLCYMKNTIWVTIIYTSEKKKQMNSS